MKIYEDGITRDATPAEIEDHKQFLLEAEQLETARKARQAAIVSARTKLAALGLSDEEIKALVG